MRLLAARMWVARNRPYYARALFACPVEFTDKTETLAVNGYWRMRANPLYTATLTVAQVAAVLVHEVNHLLRDHHGRSMRASVPDEGMELWKLAADCEVNDDLRGDGLDLPEGLLYPETLGLAPGRFAEQYYHDMLELAETPDDHHDHQGCGYEHGGPPDPQQEDVSGPGPARREQLRRQAAQDILDHQNANGTWTVPEGLRQWAASRLEPKADWRRLLASELRKGLHRRPGTGEATWARPPRRPDNDSPILRPGTAKAAADVAVVIDTSGSMGRDDLSRAIAETHAILTRAVPGEAITVHSAAHRAITAQTVTQTRQIALTGGGGTDMGQAIIDANSARPRPAIIIVITDGYTPWPPTRPPNVTATVIAVLTRPNTDSCVPQWITAIAADAFDR